jgi:hypothetical protein
VTRGRVLLALVLCAATLSGCAARVPPRPSGTAAADPTAVDAFTRAIASCKGLRTVTGELRLSGRAGGERLRGTLHAGLAAPASIRFEGVAPFGQPFFILAARDNRGTLLLPRDNRVLKDAAVSDVVGRLTGVSLSARDLRLVLTGCLSEGAQASDGKTYPGGWQTVTVAGDAGASAITAYLRLVNGTPVVAAADHGDWRIDYANHLNGFPRSVRIRSADAGTIDITAVIESLEVNTDIDDRAFDVTVPAAALPMTLEDLRSVAPLRETK